MLLIMHKNMCLTAKKSDAQKRVAGFTLMELGFVMVISGILLIAFLSIYKTTMDSINQKKLNAVMDYAYNAIFAINNGAHVTGIAYPCPANPTVPLGDPKYGTPDCTGSWTGGLISGARATKDSGANKDKVLVGYFPDYLDVGRTKPVGSRTFSTTLMTSNFTDPWNNRLIYAVSYALATTGRVNPNNGVIAVVDENGHPTNGINNNAHFVIISEGPDGTHKWPCGIATRPLEYQNCHPGPIATAVPPTTGATFISSLQNRNVVKTTAGVEAAVVGAQKNMYFDDSLRTFTAEQTADIWLSSGSADVVTKDGTATGNVGVGPTKLNPAQTLDVEGSITADQNTRASKICPQDGTNDAADMNGCFNPANIYNITCPAGQYATKIALVPTTGNLNVTCAPLSFLATGKTCSGSTPYIKSIYSDGSLECTK